MEFSGFLADTKVKLWLNAHKHKFIYNVVNIDNKDHSSNIPFITTNSLRLSHELIAKGAQIGFCKIELVREKGEVRAVHVYNVVDSGTNIKEDIHIMYDYGSETSSWSWQIM